VTKVLLKVPGLRAGLTLALLFLASEFVGATAPPADAPANRAGEALYLQLSQIGLDPARVYKVRDASIDRSSIHISLEDGTIAFTKDIMGRITGAFFEGYGEILLTPPNQVERKSMSQFTGMAILEERFATAYFRFNDDTAAEMHPDLRPPEDAPAFIARWGDTTRNLAQIDAMRLLLDFSRLLPVGNESQVQPAGSAAKFDDPFLHARLQGTKLGIFDVNFDSTAAENIQVGQARNAANGDTYYDIWTAFSPGPKGSPVNLGESGKPDAEKSRGEWITVHHYTITTEVRPPKEIHAEAHLQVDVKRPGQRTLLFELSRFLDVESVQAEGIPVEFIHNPAVEGSQLARRGNDLVAVILPEPAQSGQKIELRFVYGGEVLAEEGRGLIYVGARGTWYPNRGMAMADFDLEFHYPPGWTLVATGKPATTNGSMTTPNGLQSARWISERPIPFAGFDLGKYKVASAMAGNVIVEAYATAGVERDFPTAPAQVIDPTPVDPIPRPHSLQTISPPDPSPARTIASVADAAARAINYYAARFGPYPYSRLALTQMPGRESQGWPGLVFLSSYVFLTDHERTEMHFEPFRRLLEQQTPAHEAAHQWWGDLITWSTYRDQWISEGLANYSALMMLQETNPAGFRQIMEKYREALVEKDKDGEAPRDAGAVTLGVRLFSSRSPGGYEAISYGRGTWLFHMLRSMLLDSEPQATGRSGREAGGTDEPFVRSLRKVRQRYEGKSISTRELLDVFAEDLPPTLRYEGKKSLDWFWEGWVNGTALPKLELKTAKFTPKGTGLAVTGIILQKDAPEDLVTSVPVYGVVTGKQPVFLGRVFADGEESTFHLTAPAGTHKLLLDPNETILTAPK
jgi:Peptidase family M1 domain